MYPAYKKGVFWSFTSAFLWSTTFISSRYLMKVGAIDSISLSLLRFLIGGLILLLLGAVLFREKTFSVSATDLLKLAGLGLFGIVGMSVFLFAGQRTTTATNSSMIMQLNPIMIMVGGLFIGEKISVRQAGGVFMSLLGCFLVVNIISLKGFAYSAENMKGDFLVLLSAGCWAFYSAFSKNVVKRTGGYAATTWAMLFGALELLVLVGIISLFNFNYDYKLPVSTGQWWVIVYLGVFPTALAFFAWYEAMDKIDLSLLSVMQYLTPVFTIFMAFFMLSEKISLLNALGILFVLGGVVFTGSRKKL
jgi:drug/metabolite transporter (DMT)-like permease